MTIRRPLVAVAGKVKELPVGDGLAGGGVLYRDASPDNGAYGALSGSINGSNAAFTVSQGSYVAGSLLVFLNGIAQNQGSAADYQETTPASGIFTFITAPPTGSIIIAIYQVESSSLVSQYSVTTYTSTTVNITATAGEHVILVDAATAGGNVTVNLPTAVGNTAKYHIKKIDSGANTVTVDPNSTQTVDGSTTAAILVQDVSLTLVSDNANWRII